MRLSPACALLVAAVLACFAGAASSQTRPDAPVTAPLQDRVLPLDVTVNGERFGTWVFIERQGVLYVAKDAFDEWRLQVRPGGTPITLRGSQYWPLNAVPGYSAKVNATTLSVDLTFSPEVFTATRLKEEKQALAKPSPVLPSAFVNYDINAMETQYRHRASTQNVGALFEFAASNDWGVLTSSEVARNLTHDPQQGDSGVMRLETTFTRNMPGDRRTLRIGDAATRAGLWGRSVYFGGAQYSVNFALTPGFLTQPLPLLRGVSAAPSTVELYVNDVLRKVSQVPTGPFAIDNNLGLTGSGEAKLVMRDVLGREVVVTQPFFTSVDLLAPGLDDFSVETGVVRKNLGLENADYGGSFASGTWRRGLTDSFTGEIRGEYSRDQWTVGGGAIKVLPADWLLRGAVARSHSDRLFTAGDGTFATLGVERQWARLGVNLQAQGATRHYRELGMGDAELPIRVQWGMNGNYNFERGSVSIGAARIARFDDTPATTVSASVGYRIADGVYANFNVSRAWGSGGGTAAGITLQFPLGGRRIGNATVNSNSSGVDSFVSATDPGNGQLASNLSWRVLAGRVQNEAHSEAGLYYEGSRARLYSDASASESQTSLRVGGAGAIALAAGHVFATRRLDQSYGVVEVAGFPNVSVSLGGDVFTHTDEAGIAFVPYLSPYQKNQVRLDPNDLPLSAELNSIEQQVVPSWRSAVKIDFPVRSGRAALLKLQLVDGEVAPAGATVRIDGDSEEFYVGRRGEAFVTGLGPKNRLTMHMRGDKTCTFDVVLPAAKKDEIPRLGPLVCKGPVQ